MSRPPRRNGVPACVAVIAPIIAGHLTVFLMPGNPAALATYMLGYAASLAAASATRSFRHLLIIPVAGFAIGLAAEVVGVSTGLPFGRYEYVSLRAPRVLGVPLSVPVMWGFYAYLTYLISASAIRPGGLAGRALRVAYASALMVVLDLAMDPFMVLRTHAWVWLGGWGLEWFGIPASNFVGWYVVSAAILTTHEALVREPTVPRGSEALAAPYACLLMFFASAVSPTLTSLIAAITTSALAAPAMIAKCAGRSGGR